jgi:hypothetical protein
VGTQEFWVSVLWRADIRSFLLAVIITEGLFLTFTLWLGNLLDRLLYRTGVADLVAYVLFGGVGLLAIEWLFAGNVPGSTEANQFVMFTTWGGAALFARMFTDESARGNARTYALRFFLVFAGLATVLGLLFLAINPPLTFAVTYVAAVLGYPLMNVFFAWHFARQIRSKRLGDE